MLLLDLLLLQQISYVWDIFEIKLGILINLNACVCLTLLPRQAVSLHGAVWESKQTEKIWKGRQLESL